MNAHIKYLLGSLMIFLSLCLIQLPGHIDSHFHLSLMPVIGSVQNNLLLDDKCNSIFTWIFLMAATVLTPRFLQVGSFK